MDNDNELLASGDGAQNFQRQNEVLEQQIAELRRQLQQQLRQQNQPQQQPIQIQNVDDAAGQRNVHRVAVKLPPFWSDRPSLWFVQAESQFIISDIRNEVTKFHYIVSQLDARVAAEVEDIISHPPAVNPYTFLREKLILRLSASEEKRVRQLISEEELGDRKPSQFLRHLRSLAGATVVQDNLLRQLWLQRLPSNVQAILASQSNLALENLAELADKIIEISPMSTVSVNTVQLEKGHENNLLKVIADLQKQVAELMSSCSRPRFRSRSSNRNSNRKGPAPSKDCYNQQTTDRLCWYHSKFQHNAKKCIPPCSFSGNVQSSP